MERRDALQVLEPFAALCSGCLMIIGLLAASSVGSKRVGHETDRTSIHVGCQMPRVFCMSSLLTTVWPSVMICRAGDALSQMPPHARCVLPASRVAPSNAPIIYPLLLSSSSERCLSLLTFLELAASRLQPKLSAGPWDSLSARFRPWLRR